MKPRLVIAFLLPFVACGLQWLLWDTYIAPYVWFLFFPAAFFSAWLGGFRGGLASALIGALLVWYVFIPPQFSFELKDASASASIALFVIMGGLFGWVFERLEQAQRHTAEALDATEIANVKITRLYERTLELDELKSQFFANVSHELRTPLTLIMAPLERQLCRPHVSGEPAGSRPASADFSEAERKEAEMMLRNARQLYRHVSDLLDAAKLEAGGMRVDYARLDLAELVRAVSSNFDSVAREHNIAYRVAAPPVLTIEADGEKLQRILLNLLSNAFKFTPDGGSIAVRLHDDGGMVLIEVQDNGPGVPPEMREAVFERFRQVDGAANRRHGGTGLGLAIVREFSALHGGRVGVTAAPGGGALFAVRLPLKAPAGTSFHDAANRLDPVIEQQAAEELATPAASPAASDTPATHDAPLVLVVEDNADMNAFIVDTLRPRYRVASARDGRAGLEQALRLAPDLILADIMMPVMSGDAMVLELRQKPEMASVPIVMLTAKADDALRVKLLQAGVQDYLAKPFTVPELLARVDRLLTDRRRSGEQLRQSEVRFEATFEQAAVGIALVAPDGRWLRVNRKLCSIVGYTPEELLAKTFQDITHPDDLDADLDQVRRMLAKEITTYTLEKRYFRKDGGIVWIDLTVALVWKPNDGPDYFISVVEDITARKAAEVALRESEARLREAKRLAGLGNWHWDLQNDKHSWSEEIYGIYGRDPSLPPAVYPEVQQYFTPESWTHLVAAVEAGMTTGKPYKCDAEVVRPDGVHRWITARGEAIRDATGQTTALRGTVQDITERKVAEIALRNRNEELERFDRAAIGRELQMIELKRQVNELARELGRAPPYDLGFADVPSQDKAP
jgi:PAS domain S-box-containing protein